MPASGKAMKLDNNKCERIPTDRPPSMQTSQVVGLHAYMPTCLHACSYYVTGVGKPATRGLAYRAHVCTCPDVQVPWCQVVQR